MTKNIKLAVAGAVLAMSASAAHAGIVIPAGDWTLDINGNVNAFVNYTHANAAAGAGVTAANGGLASGANANNAAAFNPNKQLGINTGLLPSWLGFTGTTRQNDVDVTFNMSMQPNVSDNGAAGDAKAPLFRTAYLSFGDKSWGSIKLGKDIGIFASDAILNDMTLLGVGAGAGLSGASTTLGGIGSGYIYAGWKGQATYTTPNFNGFQASVGIFNPNGSNISQASSVLAEPNQDRFGYEAKASYSFAANDVTGKLWVSGASYDVTLAAQANGGANSTASYTASVGDIGATVSAGPFSVVGYYYSGTGVGTTTFGNLGVYAPNAATKAKRDSDGGYIQGVYTTPFKTKIGAAYGISNLDTANAADLAANGGLVSENERVTVGLYHPLTKHLNLVGEYNNITSKSQIGGKNESNTYSAGAILFF